MKLLPETQDIIQKAESATGRPVVIREDPTLTVDGVWRYREEGHLIAYHPRWKQNLDHTVAHECGHILRSWPELSSTMYFAASTLPTRKKAFHDLMPDYAALVQRGLPLEAIQATLDVVYQGAIEQLTNVAPDIHIERWIHETYPALQKIQARSLARDVHERHISLHPIIRITNPKRIYEANQTLNSAWATFVEDLIKSPGLSRPYSNTPYERAGKELLEVLDAEVDCGSQTDRRITDLWSSRLGMDGWYVWTEVSK